MTFPLQPDHAVSVSAVTSAASKLIRDGLGDIWVRGEVVEYKIWRSGHHYFCVRDSSSQLRCVMWKADGARLKRAPAAGTEVFMFGRPTLWEEKGEFRFTAKLVLPTAAMGAAQVEFERVKALLHADGLFDPGRKRPLPARPLRIAVITSTDGAALRDVAIVARRRWPMATLLVVGARVQGEGAPESITRAVAIAARIRGVQLCVITRGGGAREDLAAFNSEMVCRALAAMPVPVVSAVGHETDISLSDLVADHRSATPSAAMEEVLPDHRAVRTDLATLGQRLATGLSARTQRATERLLRFDDRYRNAMDVHVQRRRHSLEHGAGRLDALSPLRVLDRGYAVALDASGRTLRSVADFADDQAFVLRVSDGTVPARVDRPRAEQN